MAASICMLAGWISSISFKQTHSKLNKLQKVALHLWTLSEMYMYVRNKYHQFLKWPQLHKQSSQSHDHGRVWRHIWSAGLIFFPFKKALPNCTIFFESVSSFKDVRPYQIYVCRPVISFGKVYWICTHRNHQFLNYKTFLIKLFDQTQ